ncbi:DUF4954 family protein [Treponema berlinense]|uniref:DUF4954 family protein n=1 Tax=Treponema berlinense TaxID=225004 RepID=UPI0026EC3A97|nr:DUF4954 family protein [Treponema berlinense]
MPVVALKKQNEEVEIPENLSDILKNKRHLTDAEISVLKSNGNINSDSSWQNVFVSAAEGEFDPSLIRSAEIHGFLVLGRLVPSTLKFHDLVLEAGIYNSYVENLVLEDDVALRNVAYLSNYRIGSRSIIFNVQEMSCTCHSKFGNGILKQGESEDNRIWIGVGNENDGRAVLPFEDMITADAYIWSCYREDAELQKRFVELTEYGQSKKLDTFGIVGQDVIIKNSSLLKDAKIGDCCYIKGAFKIKNVTVLSSEEEPSQIGEGVELVNGIMGFGSKVFYQAVAVRFVIGRNCQLKYGARLLNSVLGDNSTISCCEILNNLIFPFHEQHHNSSFLIASTLCGQTNIASGATIGSNHNSRSPDGEMFAGRGFWPGLCSDFKHNSRFACFTLVSKGSFQHELNIKYPFSLVASNGEQKCITIIPAYWFLYNMYAIARNKSKFTKRDKRVKKVQHIETDPLAPDSIQEVTWALGRIVELTGRYLVKKGWERAVKAESPEELQQVAADFLHKNSDVEFSLCDFEAQKKYGAEIHKPVRAYKMYRKIIKYFACSVLMEYCTLFNTRIDREELKIITTQLPLYTKWVNVGGQIIPEKKLEELFEKIKSRKIENWSQVHAFYDKCQKEYLIYRTNYAIYLLERLYSMKVRDFTPEIFQDIIADTTEISCEMLNAAHSSREKDFIDEFRKITFRNDEEMAAVLGTMEDNEFLSEMKEKTAKFNEALLLLFNIDGGEAV